MARSRTILLAALLLALAVGSCSRPPSRDDPIRAHDDTSFQTWLDEHSTALTPAEVKEITEARQLIRFREMQAHPGRPSAELAEAVYATINGKPVRDLLITGCELQVNRVEVELENYRPLMDRLIAYRDNHRLTDEQKTDTAAKLANLERLMREHREELERLKQHLAALKQTPAATKQS